MATPTTPFSTTLNPSKTLNPNTLSSFPQSNLSTLKPTALKSKNLTRISASTMSNQNQKVCLESSSNKQRREQVMEAIKSVGLDNCLSETNLHLSVPSLKSKTRGKVRDIYDAGDYLVLVTTDRQSAFDRVLASIPFKGQVLNEASLWWFGQTEHITPNAIVSSPDKNVSIAKKCSVFPVEFVANANAVYSEYPTISNGLQNVWPRLISVIYMKQIVKRGLMTQDEYDEASTKALSLFEYGQRVASEHGLILVDTKYEFGKSRDGTVMLIDEVHTPDSSRYWIAHSYEERFKNGLEPENVDKEFLRLWFKDNCNPYEDEVLPAAPEELVTELAWRYIFLFETITKSKFQIPMIKEPIHDRISRNVSQALSSLQ
nr:PREDICTED: phosphoribosylaminoimidazole-succinocarboxamide synthase, chloroplastic [Daucus carota subsp. sativus]